MTMERIAYIHTHNGVKRRVLVEDGIPVELAYEAEDHVKTLGNIYLGRVEKVLKGMESAFVEIGLPKNAFLPLLDVPQMLHGIGDTPSYRQTVRQGQQVLVQVTKDPIGEKGARVTMNVTLPGKLCVLLPTVQALGVSKQIQNETKREALLAIATHACPDGMGILIRTAAEHAAPEAIALEAQALAETWSLMKACADAQKAPALLFDTGNLLESAARDLSAKIILEPLPKPLDEKLVKALRRKVWLDSGAYLIIDPCEAMTVIDVNSGKYTGKRSLNDTAIRLNCEAAAEVARQIRLRDLGGIIIVDFIDMDSDEDRAAVMKVFQEAVSRDRAKRHIHGFTAAGLLEMTRRSVHQSVYEHTGMQCPYCQGTGILNRKGEPT